MKSFFTCSRIYTLKNHRKTTRLHNSQAQLNHIEFTETLKRNCAQNILFIKSHLYVTADTLVVHLTRDTPFNGAGLKGSVSQWAAASFRKRPTSAVCASAENLLTHHRRPPRTHAPTHPPRLRSTGALCFKLE